MADKYEIKAEMLGPEKGMKREVRILNRIFTWAEDGVHYVADQRHADIIISQLLLRNAKPVATPCSPDCAAHHETRNSSPLLEPADATAYRALAARLS